MKAVILLICLSASMAVAQTTQPATKQSPPQPAHKPTSAEATLSQMLKPTGPAVKSLAPTPDAPMVDANSGKGAVTPAASSQNVLREGTYLVDRVGRLQRSPDGSQMEFHFDSDGKALRDPPVVIIPSLTLMQMENAVVGNSRDLRFRITGRVTEYRGRNYVLLEKAVVVSDVAQPF